MSDQKLLDLAADPSVNAVDKPHLKKLVMREVTKRGLWVDGPTRARLRKRGRFE